MEGGYEPTSKVVEEERKAEITEKLAGQAGEKTVLSFGHGLHER
ncbi:hypothetical protein [Sporisorium scitamineum]|uniref:Uncharacterized protein n=1 Tax=Sporisorium scitamineum TaxID=49012 RepID=A0A0F7S699_9BASI|nr:hypothetical protein [Sporisorium scitamineum]